MQRRHPSTTLENPNQTSIRRRSTQRKLPSSRSADGLSSDTTESENNHPALQERDDIDIRGTENVTTIRLVTAEHTASSPEGGVVQAFHDHFPRAISARFGGSIESSSSHKPASVVPEQYISAPPTTSVNLHSDPAPFVTGHRFYSPRLPTPDYTTPSKKKYSTGSLFSRALSFFPFDRIQPPSSLSEVLTGPLSKIGRKTKRSFLSTDRHLSNSGSSHPKGVFAASVHHAIIPSLSTTHKFTHKWPRLQSVRSLSTSQRYTAKENQSGRAVALALEGGYGLGVERIKRWTIHKWFLLLSVIIVLAYGITGLILAIITWFRAWQHADVTYVADYDILVLLTLAGCILVLSAVVGLSGTLLNSRPILAIYALLLWPALIALLAVGYAAYKRATFALDRKLDLAWSQYYTPYGRLLIQESLGCCGYYSPLHDASPSARCYSRTSLPGCKGKLYRFERMQLATIWSATFSLVPLHILAIVVALLCANHVTRRFGKGILPRAYWLRMADVREEAEKFFKAGLIARPVMAERAPANASMTRDKIRMTL